MPTVNPPGELYEDCARFIGGTLAACGFEVEYHAAEGRPEHTRTHPRINVVGTRRGAMRCGRSSTSTATSTSCPAGDGWTVDPFGGEVRDGRIWGRGACDMKAGHRRGDVRGGSDPPRRRRAERHASRSAAPSTRRAAGSPASRGWPSTGGSAPDRTDFVIIPEPLYVDRICIGHRGVYWFEVETKGRIAHGSMPFHGVSAIEHMGMRARSRSGRELQPRLAARTTAMPVIPPGRAARDAQHQRHRRRPAGATASRRRASPIAAAPSSIGGSCSRRASTPRRRRSSSCSTTVARDVPDFNYELARSDGRASDADARRLAGGRRRSIGRSTACSAEAAAWWPAPAPTIRSTSPASPACRTASPTGRASSSSRTSRTSTCDIADLVNATKVIALAILELTDRCPAESGRNMRRIDEVVAGSDVWRRPHGPAAALVHAQATAPDPKAVDASRRQPPTT